MSRLEQIAEIFGIELAELVGFNEKSIFYMSGNNATGQHTQENCVINFMDKDGQSLSLQGEIEKLKALIASKDKELTSRDTDIANLKKIISLLESGS